MCWLWATKDSSGERNFHDRARYVMDHCLHVGDGVVDDESEIPRTALAGAILGALTIGTVSAVLAPRGSSNKAGSARRGAVGGAIVGATSGAFAGWQRIYDWRNRRGRLAFVADHTWALMTTCAGVIVGVMNFSLGAKVEDSLSRRHNRLVFDRGVVLRPGFALSTGYVVSGATDRQGHLTMRRRRLVTNHEDVHIWQARRWGPLYPVLYGVWFIGGVLVGLRKWSSDRTGRSLLTHIDAAAYYSNPFEWRAYTDDENWPPATADSSLVWSRRFGGVRVRDS